MPISKKTPLLIVVPYLLFSAVYVVVSNKVASHLSDEPHITTWLHWSINIFYICFSGLVLYLLVRHYLKRLNKSKNELITSFKLYRSLIEHASDLTIVCDIKGNAIFAGANISKILGYSMEELVGSNIFDKAHSEDSHQMQVAFAQALARPGTLITDEGRVLHKDGHYVWLEANITNRLDDPEIQGIVINARDVTQRKGTEKKLLHSELLFRSAFEQIAMGMANLDLDGNMVHINDQMYRITGYRKEILADMKIWDLLPANERAVFEQYFEQLKAGGANDGILRKLIERQDGRKMWAEVLMTLIRGEDTAPLYVRFVIRDIDAVVAIEEGLAYRNKELDTFIYRSSHDLRGPITTLMGLTDLGEMETTDSKAKEYFANCRVVAGRLETVLDALMDVTTIRQTQANVSKVAPRVIVYAILHSKTYEAQLNRTALSLQIDETAAYYTDEELLGIILTQLIDNALTFIDENKGKHSLTVTMDADDKIIHLSVKDNGIGIAEKDQPNIFDLYYRGVGKHKGSGIGLYTVKAAVEKLGGRVFVNSVAREGTEMVVLLPNKCTQPPINSH